MKNEKRKMNVNQKRMSFRQSLKERRGISLLSENEK